jgi:hypothetical protein
LAFLRTISNSSWQNGLDASVLENKGFTTFISGGGGGGIFVSVIFMNAKVIILSRTHKVREREKG